MTDPIEETSPDLVPARAVAPTQRPDADSIAQAVLSVPGVHSLHAGAWGEVATYLPGRRVNGVRLRPESCEIHVVLEFAAAIERTTDAIRAALRPRLTGPIDVTVEDLATR